MSDKILDYPHALQPAAAAALLDLTRYYRTDASPMRNDRYRGAARRSFNPLAQFHAM